MDVNGAIRSMEARIERAKNAATRYQTKGNEQIARMSECEDEDEVFIAWGISNAYYTRVGMVKDYIEELEELLNVLKGKIPEEKVTWTTEEDFEEEWGIDFDSVEWSNTAATIYGFRNSDNATITWVICMLKSLKDI